jgi:hypothetical protein
VAKEDLRDKCKEAQAKTAFSCSFIFLKLALMYATGNYNNNRDAKAAPACLKEPRLPKIIQR